MGIRVRDDVIERLGDNPARFALQVRDPDDLEAALAALRLARVDLVGLSGRGRRPEVEGGRDAATTDRADVSQVVAAPDGPLVLVQHLDADPADLARVPDLVVDRLVEAGVDTATVVSPELGGDLDGLDRAPGCVVLRLFPTPGGPATTIPPRWLDLAVEWVVGDLAPDDTVATRILSVEHVLAAGAAAAMLHECGLTRAWCDLVNGDLEDRIRTASLTYGRLPHLALAAGGPGVDGSGLLARYELLQEVARDLAGDAGDELAYACLDLEPTFEGLALGLPVDGWRARGGASPNRVAATIVDQVVPDAYPWQILGPGHVERLEAAGDAAELPLAELPGTAGLVELELDHPTEWVPRSARRIEAQEDGMAWLAALLVDPEEAEALVAARSAPGAAIGDGAGTAAGMTTLRAPAGAAATAGARRSPFAVATAGTGRGDATAPGDRSAAPATTAPPPDLDPTLDGAPDLDDVVLRATPSVRRSTRLTPLELAAWFAREGHSDQPAAVAPVLATFVRWWASGLDDETRQRLKPYVPRLVGTAAADDEPEADPDADIAGDDEERARRWLAADWLVRVQAVTWLRVAGLVDAAERLSRVGPLIDETELAAAIEVLGSAITVAGRRIDITASIAANGEDGDDDVDDDDRLAWEAWERVTEATAWVAASEAATRGTPGEVAYLTDARVIEVSRDPARRDELERTGSTVGGTAWATAFHAVGDEAWEQAWRAADRAARDHAGLTIRVEMGRVAKTALHRSISNDDVPEAALEVAEQAAREALVRAAIRGGEPDRDGEHPWDAARDAARSSSGGGAWSVVIDESRRAIGEDAWQHAMTEARRCIDDLLADAPDTVARVVAVALAREACSGAARGVAYRAAAVARAHGADDLGAEQAAAEALAATAAELREAAFELLDALLDPPAL